MAFFFPGRMKAVSHTGLKNTRQTLCENGYCSAKLCLYLLLNIIVLDVYGRFCIDGVSNAVNYQ